LQGLAKQKAIEQKNPDIFKLDFNEKRITECI